MIKSRLYKTRSQTEANFERSVSPKEAIAGNTGGADAKIYDRLIKIGELGNLRGIRGVATNSVIVPFFRANQGANSDNWTEVGVNEQNPTDENVGPPYDRSQEEFEIFDDLLAALNGKTIRFVAHYTGSFNCEASAATTGFNPDIYNKPSGSNTKGDMQITNVQQERVTQSGTSNGIPTYTTSGQSSFDWTFVTSAANVKARSNGETPLDTYKKQGESPSAWKVINTVSNSSNSFTAGEINKSLNNRKTPTSGSGGLSKPQKYEYFCSAYVNTNYETEMWARTNAQPLDNILSNPSGGAWDRITCALGSHGDACGTWTLYIYVEPWSLQQSTPGDTTDPTGPDLVSSNIENDQVTLTWEPASDNVGVDGYHVYYRYRGVDETSFSSFDFVGMVDSEETQAVYSLNDSSFGLPERYGEFSFKIEPRDFANNVGTGNLFPVKGQFEDISFVKSGTQIVSSGGQTLSITGIQANDLILVAGTSDNIQPDAPSGFTEIQDDDGTSNPGASVSWKLATSTSESITLPNQGGTGANRIIWSYQVFRNVSTSSPIDVSASNHNAGTSRINLPAVTTTVDNAMIAVYGMVDDDGYPSLSLPTGYTRTVMDSTGDGLNSNFTTVVGGYKLESTAGTYSPGAILLSENDGRDGFTVALRPRSEDFKTTAPSFSYIYWEATQSTSTAFYVYCEFNTGNYDIPTSATAYVTIDGSTPSTTNYATTATLIDTSTASNGSTWNSSAQLGFNSSGVSLNDDVKVLIVANNAKGDTTSEVVTLTVSTLGQNSVEWPDTSTVSFVKSESYTTTGTATVNFTMTGIQSGDFVLATVAADSTNVGDAITGWTLIADGEGIHDAAYYYAFATGSSINMTSSDDECVVVFTAFRNVDSTTPFDATTPSLVSTSAVESTTPASITTATDGAMVVLQLGVDDIDATGVSAPTGYTKAGSGYQMVAPASAISFYKSIATAGTETPGTITYDAGGGGEHSHCLTVALRPG